MSKANKRLPKDVDPLVTFVVPFRYNTTQRCMFYYKYIFFFFEEILLQVHDYMVSFLAIKSDHFYLFFKSSPITIPHGLYDKNMKGRLTLFGRFVLILRLDSNGIGLGFDDFHAESHHDFSGFLCIL